MADVQSRADIRVTASAVSQCGRQGDFSSSYLFPRPLPRPSPCQRIEGSEGSESSASDEQRQYARRILRALLVAEARHTHAALAAMLPSSCLMTSLKAILLAACLSVPGVRINTRGHDMIDESRQRDQMK